MPGPAGRCWQRSRHLTADFTHGGKRTGPCTLKMQKKTKKTKNNPLIAYMREISASQDQRQGTLRLQDTALLYKHNTTWVFLVFNFGRKKVSITCCRSVILICPHQLHLWVALNIQANEGGEGGGGEKNKLHLPLVLGPRYLTIVTRRANRLRCINTYGCTMRHCVRFL